MKVPLKTKTVKATNRVSALNRLSKTTPIQTNNQQIHRQRNATAAPTITDARQLLSNRNKPVFDARQLLSRQSSKTPNSTSLVIQRGIISNEEDSNDDEEQDSAVISKFKIDRAVSEIPDIFLNTKKNTLANFQNSNSLESFSFTKTIINTSYSDGNNDQEDKSVNRQLTSPNKKLNINFSKDKGHKRPKSPSPEPYSPPPRIKRLSDASIQTTRITSSSQSPIQMSSYRRRLSEEDDDLYEPLQKRSSSRTAPVKKEQQSQSISSQYSLKTVSSNRAPDSARVKQKSSVDSNSYSTTVLITNLQSTVTEDDLLDLFGEVGHIDEIKTISSGCVQIIFSKPEHAKQAVTNYHNQLLDGKLIYVSLQQPSSHSTKSLKDFSSSRHSKSPTPKRRSDSPSKNNNEYSKTNSGKITIDPTFMRQALFYSSNNTTNPVQFQVKL